MTWEDIQDAIDKWAMDELPGEYASEARGCIMSWSDLIAQAIVKRMEAAPVTGQSPVGAVSTEVETVVWSSPIAFMHEEHVDAYRRRTGSGIAWASPVQTDFYTTPVFLRAEKAGALVAEDQNASANEAPATLHIVAVLRAMAENYAVGHAWSEVDAYQVRAAADLIERMRQP